MSYKNAALLHEGGTTSAIASYLYFTGNALHSSHRFENVYVMKDGWKHLFGDSSPEEGKHYINFLRVNVKPESRANPMGTSRKCPVPTPNHKDADYTDRIVERLKSLDVGVLVTKGGDDERWIDAKLTGPLNDAGIFLVGQPKTIDIDLMTDTDFNGIKVSDTPGARSAIVNIGRNPSLVNLKYEAMDNRRVFTVGVMGRNCGELALAVANRINADYCIIPEYEMTPERIERFMSGIKKGQVAVVSEGAKWWNEHEGKCTEFFVYRNDGNGNHTPLIDEHGRKTLGKAHEQVAEIIERTTEVETRPQATDYMGRSGPPFEGDVHYESVLARKTMQLIEGEKSGVMPAPSRVVPYREMCIHFHDVRLPPPDDYDTFKKLVIQPFNVEKFYDGENFRWTDEFGKLVKLMLTPQ